MFERSKHTFRCGCDDIRDAPQGHDVRDAPPGAGVALAALLGSGGMMLACAVWIAGAGLGWAALTWLLAGPSGLLVFAMKSGRTAHGPRQDCENGRCRSRGLDAYPWSSVNV